MQCFKVLVHGRLVWLEGSSVPSADSQSRPHGFYAHRFVLSPDASAAELKAIEKVRSNIDRQTGWLKNGLAKIELEAEEVVSAPIFRGLLPKNLGHTFYDED